jgi:hypothetical protein
MSADIEVYEKLITSEHCDKPKFLATVGVGVQPSADVSEMLLGLPLLYDLDVAVGEQLDRVGQWVGRTRYLATPIVDVYFTLDQEGLGFDQGTWLGLYDPINGLTALPDDAYRTLLRAKILANTWDGTVPGAYEAWNTVFSGTGYQILIQDNGDMTMALALIGPLPDAVTTALFSGGYLSLKPAGVGITFYATSTVASSPLFGFDAQSSGIAGFDTGAFANLIMPS